MLAFDELSSASEHPPSAAATRAIAVGLRKGAMGTEGESSGNSPAAATAPRRGASAAKINRPQRGLQGKKNQHGAGGGNQRSGCGVGEGKGVKLHLQGSSFLKANRDHNKKKKKNATTGISYL